MNTPTSQSFQYSVYNPAYPRELEAVFHRAESDEDVLSQLLPALGYLLKCDYCLLYLRHPDCDRSKVTHYWEKHYHPRVVEDSWHREDTCLLSRSWLFNAALSAEHSVFIDDVDVDYKELLSSDPLLRGERALVQGHIIKNNQLWGVLRVGVFDRPRSWKQFDRSLIIHSVQRLVPHAISYVQAMAPS
ncbi:MAG: GAF domain-containing protein [Cyanobacteria bacterium P01_D01_bin.56]